jgi:hypothetical protein
MTPSEKHAFWKQHIEGWRNSGKSQKAYCAEHGLSFSNFGYWRKRFSKPGRFIPVTLDRPVEHVKLYLPSGIRIDVSVDALAHVVSALEGRR